MDRTRVSVIAIDDAGAAARAVQRPGYAVGGSSGGPSPRMAGT